uniref:hypothetical protein n=1 Tax=Prosthecobacter sp. TaxID=1965333 RepID=UPI003783A4D9
MATASSGPPSPSWKASNSRTTSPTGAIIRDAHAGNILVKSKELFPIDVIVTDLGSLTDAERTTK